ncbi:peptidase MA family metallohydrolase [Gordonia sp. MP11Mi]|uniref:Peptidase MA-like domain-containing protein n=1 Tax=Gordonia sp. MP11Mi TaxID=3022769 RepID=A0AA97CXI0_9ACTN
MAAVAPRAAAAAVAVALTVVGTVAACSDSSEHSTASSAGASTTPLNPFEQQRTDGVGALLDELSSVLRTGDRAGLDGLIDDAAPRSIIDRLHTAVAAFAPSKNRGRRGGPLATTSFTYRVAPSTGPEWQVDPALAAKVDEAGASDTWVTPVELTYALGGSSTPGLAEPEVSLTETMVFARYGDDWKVLGDAASASNPQPTTAKPAPPAEVGPWEFTGLAAADVRTAGGTSVILSYPKTDKTLTRIESILPNAIAAVSKFWGDDWTQKAAVVTTGDQTEFSGLTRTAASDTTVAAAATVFSRIDRRAKQVVGQRIVLSPNAVDLSEPALAVVLRHELMHVATRLSTSEISPMWLTEGVPEYVGRKGTYREFVDAAPDLAVEVAADRVPKKLPVDSDFAVDSDAARVAYQSAWSFAAFVADKYGESKLKDMYRKMTAAGDTPAMDAAMKTAVGHDKNALVKQWQTWLRAQVR